MFQSGNRLHFAYPIPNGLRNIYKTGLQDIQASIKRVSDLYFGFITKVSNATPLAVYEKLSVKKLSILSKRV